MEDVFSSSNKQVRLQTFQEEQGAVDELYCWISEFDHGRLIGHALTTPYVQLQQAIANAIFCYEHNGRQFTALCCAQDVQLLHFLATTDSELGEAETALSAGWVVEALPSWALEAKSRAEITDQWRLRSSFLGAEHRRLERVRDSLCANLTRLEVREHERESLSEMRQINRLAEWIVALETGRLPVSSADNACGEPLDKLSWREAETLAEAVLRALGWSDAVVTGGGADGGLDVQSRNVAAQVKYTSSPVGRPVLQQLVGAGRGRNLACFSSAGYSTKAERYADEEEIALFVIELPDSCRPANATAVSWMRYRPS